MRLVERFSIIVFSILVLVLSCFTMFISTNLMSTNVLEDLFEVFSDNLAITICVCILLSLWSIANIFFKSDAKKQNVNGILLENENGSLLITKDSISNLVESVIKKNNDVKQENVKIEFTTNKDIIINIVVSVKDSIVMKETSAKLQENIKMIIKKATDLDVKQINIKIKGIEQEKKTQTA